MSRRANLDLNTKEMPWDWEHVHIEILLDIREELRSINRTLKCPSFQGIPGTLDSIKKNTQKPKRKRT